MNLLRLRIKESTLPPTGLRRTNQVVLKLDLRLAGRRHRGIEELDNVEGVVMGRGVRRRGVEVGEVG